jgi:TolB-like protein/Tfp pilus assembly protein PilF
MAGEPHNAKGLLSRPQIADRLESWKEIANYLHKGVRTVQRWEKEEGLPVHRHLHDKLSTVYAYKDEIDAWWQKDQERLKTEEEVQTRNVPTGVRRWVLAVVAFGTVVAGVAYLSWQHPQSTAPADSLRLVVLPLENLSGDPAQDYLSVGITEELIARLARLDPARLAVVARTTAMTYAGTDKTIEDVGRELDADYILEGSVRKDRDHLRFTAQLIDTSDQAHVWAQSYDRELDDILTLEAELAQAVADNVRLAVSPAAVSPERLTVDPKAHQAYLQARYYQSQGTVLAQQKAIEFFEQSLEIDPGFALAQAGLARSNVFGLRARPRSSLARAKQQAIEAVRLDPDLPEARLSLALAKLYNDWDWNGAEEEFLLALQLDPGNADMHFHYAQYLAAVGQLDEAIAAARRAQELDPFSPLIGHYLGRLYLFARDFEQAERELSRTLELAPNYPWTVLFLAITYEQLGQLDQAALYRQRYWAVSGLAAERVNELGELYAASGYNRLLQEWADWIEDYALRDGYVTSTELALTYTEMGRTNEAFVWLERAFESHTRDLVYLEIHPGFDPLRSDPRFDSFLARLKFPRGE